MSAKNPSQEQNKGIVLILDDEPGQARALRLLIEKAGYSVLEFESLEELNKQWDWSQPSCLVTDLRKLGSKGHLSREIAKEPGPLPIIVLSGHHVPDATVAVDKSSFQWMARPPQETEMTDALRLAVDQDRMHFQRLARVQQVRRRLKTLTPQELQVLDLLMAGKPNKVIARTLDIGIRTVELRRHCVFRKLKANSLAELVLMVAETKLLDRTNGT
jgi:two-component system, LuxR family, response regulator FixJ